MPNAATPPPPCVFVIDDARAVRDAMAQHISDAGCRCIALDSAARLLTSISAPQADEINKMKMELRRLIFDEQMRVERRRGAGTAIESQATGALTPWREVATPHRDVASGRYQQAEFAADLWQVWRDDGVPKDLPSGVDKSGYIKLTAAAKAASPAWAEEDIFVV